jgi:hypothetical protein
VVQSLDILNYAVYVSPGKKGEPARWQSGGAGLSYLVARGAYEILTAPDPRTYLTPADEGSRLAVQPPIELARAAGFRAGSVPLAEDAEEGRWWLFTFAGERANRLLADALGAQAGAFASRVSAFSCSFKLPENAGASEIAGWWDKLGRLLPGLDTRALAELVSDPVTKNAFVPYLPEEAKRQVTAELLYDPAGLSELVAQNSLESVKLQRPRDFERLLYSLQDTGPGRLPGKRLAHSR